jgi:hypothetical protein
MAKAMTAKQVKFFGTKAQRAALKRKKVSPNRRRVAKNSSSVPAVAAPRKKRRKRPAAVGVTPPHRKRAKSNPGGASLFGSSLTSKNGLMIIGGGFTGLIVAKTLPSLLPSSSIGSSSTGKFVLALASAWAGAWAGRKFVSSSFGDGVLFGGMIQAGSIALDAFLPAVYSSLGIGLGDLLPGKFPVPQNPIRAALASKQIAAPVAPGSTPRVAMSGLTRAFGSAF